MFGLIRCLCVQNFRWSENVWKSFPSANEAPRYGEWSRGNIHFILCPIRWVFFFSFCPLHSRRNNASHLYMYYCVFCLTKCFFSFQHCITSNAKEQWNENDCLCELEGRGRMTTKREKLKTKFRNKIFMRFLEFRRGCRVLSLHFLFHSTEILMQVG
jgi:hypothetical protein